MAREGATLARDHEPVLLEEISSGIATLTLNRPRRLNALDEALLEALDTALARLAALPAAEAPKVLLLKGSRRSFCYGADVEAMRQAGLGAEEFRALLERFQSVIRRLARFPCPTIAVVAGFATGAGLDLALACDMRLASEKAKLGEAFIRMGLVPDGGGTLHLPHAVGAARACEMALLGEPVGAAEAERIGLVNRVLPADRLDEEAGALAGQIAARDPEAVRLTLALLRRDRDAALDEALAAEAEAQVALWSRIGADGGA